jgi:amiloride-sensitive sodium channel
MTFPARAVRQSLGLLPARINNSELSNYCQFKQSRIFFHLPNEIPTPFHEAHPVEYHRLKEYRIEVESKTTDEALRGFSPHQRDCYFEGERSLKFFKTYTKAHCYWECMTNYTLKLCGCVKFSMPRDEKTRVCEHPESNCYIDAMETWPNISSNDQAKPCDCLSPCHDINYKISSGIDTVMDKNVGKMYVNYFFFRIHGYAANVYETVLAYNLQNFM